CACFGLSW
nr:immunoglobulin heavy chain junction region [Macaca mulatta]MOV87304.1 immunoglobulin heavy chain junction region [Macaca mulatta]MOV87467.1 immunoglobulin heavy chain junction region [Macaca mulatta]MOV87822.1 immunoglobulin heavy chain junction region [Macaca mulatta]MOV87875.1 immunoglobulin heavy chain junction region [Macaca mulatta]